MPVTSTQTTQVDASSLAQRAKVRRLASAARAKAVPTQAAPTKTAPNKAAKTKAAKTKAAETPAAKKSGTSPLAKTVNASVAPAKKAAAERSPMAELHIERATLVRDSFTMPKADFELLGSLKQRALKLGHEVKKSELLRAGLHALAASSEASFSAAVVAVPRLKTGRPRQKKNK